MAVLLPLAGCGGEVTAVSDAAPRAATPVPAAAPPPRRPVRPAEPPAELVRHEALLAEEPLQDEPLTDEALTDEAHALWLSLFPTPPLDAPCSDPAAPPWDPNAEPVRHYSSAEPVPDDEYFAKLWAELPPPKAPLPPPLEPLPERDRRRLLLAVGACADLAAAAPPTGEAEPPVYERMELSAKYPQRAKFAKGMCFIKNGKLQAFWVSDFQKPGEHSYEMEFGAMPEGTTFPIGHRLWMLNAVSSTDAFFSSTAPPASGLPAAPAGRYVAVEGHLTSLIFTSLVSGHLVTRSVEKEPAAGGNTDDAGGNAAEPTATVIVTSPLPPDSTGVAEKGAQYRVRVGDRVPFVRDPGVPAFVPRRLRVRRIVPPDPALRLLGWVEFDPVPAGDDGPTVAPLPDPVPDQVPDSEPAAPAADE